jgi:hypothetical protein
MYGLNEGASAHCTLNISQCFNPKLEKFNIECLIFFSQLYESSVILLDKYTTLETTALFRELGRGQNRGKEFGTVPQLEWAVS